MRTEKIKLQGSLNGEKDPVLYLIDDHYLTPRGFRVPFWVVDTFGGNFEEQEPDPDPVCRTIQILLDGHETYGAPGWAEGTLITIHNPTTGSRVVVNMSMEVSEEGLNGQEPESLTMQEDTPVFSMSQVYEIFNQVKSHHKEILPGDSIPDWLEKWGIRPKVAPHPGKAIQEVIAIMRRDAEEDSMALRTGIFKYIERLQSITMPFQQEPQKVTPQGPYYSIHFNQLVTLCNYLVNTPWKRIPKPFTKWSDFWESRGIVNIGDKPGEWYSKEDMESFGTWMMDKEGFCVSEKDLAEWKEHKALKAKGGTP